MPMSYTIDPVRKLIRATGSGVLTDDDVMEHRRALAADPKITRGMPEISDVRQVRDFQVTVAGIRIMVAADARMVASGGMHKLAVVAEENVAYGMSRMYQTLGEPNIRSSIGVFRDYKEAEDWLGTA
jgi:hypothetical protein